MALYNGRYVARLWSARIRILPASSCNSSRTSASVILANASSPATCPSFASNAATSTPRTRFWISRNTGLSNVSVASTSDVRDAVSGAKYGRRRTLAASDASCAATCAMVVSAWFSSVHSTRLVATLSLEAGPGFPQACLNRNRSVAMIETSWNSL
ncbi:hypothetical protein BC828DRAFT_391105 [Blastocladiella britannica]|nr:hypothetical protein BC828DRAFT_391105 [Blastocladiella britannica]